MFKNCLICQREFEASITIKQLEIKGFSMLHRSLVLVVISLLITTQVQAQTSNVMITPFFGFIGGGAVEDNTGKSYDLNPSTSYAIALETPLEKGRVGFFYSYQGSDLQGVENQYGFHYLHFQSSIYYPSQSGFTGYLGLGLGSSYADVDWADKKFGFSASIFGGIEYKVSDNLALTAQLRWLGTVVDNDTSGVCTSSEAGQNCVIRFETDWMNQLQSNLGLTFKF